MRRRLSVLAGLAALAACTHLAAAPAVLAQGAPPSRPPGAGTGRASNDSTGTDSLRPRMRVLTADDTIKAPTAAAYIPLTIGARNGARHWDRDQLFSAGALTLGELLTQVPGTTLMAGGFMLAPAVVAWHGDPGGVRLFIDGVERDELNPRNGGVTDFALVPLWTLEDVTVEEIAGELRVHARSWRVTRTTASTRTDVLTGSENINLFRGFFGQRSAHGVAVQVAAQQLSTTSIPGMGGDALGAFARIGWAVGRWSVDAAMTRQGLNRDPGARYALGIVENRSAVPGFRGVASTAHLRAAWGDAAVSRVWVQATAATSASQETSAASSAARLPVTDSADTTASQGDYVAAAGVNRGSLRISANLRARSRTGVLDVAPAGRLEYARGALSLSGHVGRRIGGTGVWDARAQFEPMTWLRVSGSVGESQPSGGTRARKGATADVAVGWHGRWVSAGVRQIGGGDVAGTIALDTAVAPATVAEGTAAVASVRAPIARGWNIQSEFLSWSHASAYRPQRQARTRLWFQSSFLEQLPAGTFNILAALQHEHRSELLIPTLRGAPLRAAGWSAFGTLLELRIGSAVISWDYRNMTSKYYETFPGLVMPRIANVYGVRWQFWG